MQRIPQMAYLCMPCGYILVRELRYDEVLRSSLPASHAQATPKQSILVLPLVPGACYVRNTTT